MNESKQWYRSKTIWASLVTMVIGVLSTLGIAGIETEKDAIVETIMQTITIVSGAVALFGRITAKSKLTKK